MIEIIAAILSKQTIIVTIQILRVSNNNNNNNDNNYHKNNNNNNNNNYDKNNNINMRIDSRADGTKNILE